MSIQPDFWEHFSRGLQEIAEDYDHAFAHYCFDLLPIGISIVDFEGIYLHVNTVYRDALGYELDELLEVRSFWDLTTPDTMDTSRRTIESSENFGHFGWIEKAYIHKNGTRVPARVRGQVIKTRRSGTIAIAVVDFL